MMPDRDERDTADINYQIFVRGLAHDFNNLVAGILGHAGLIELSSEPGSEVNESAVIIRQAAERAAELAQTLLQSETETVFQIVNVHETVGEVTRLIAPTLGAGIEVRLDLSAPYAIVSGIPIQIHQMLLNLALNARDAMPGGGVITFGTREAEAGVIEIHVRDTGKGIPADLQQRIFEPAFTTKSVEGGTGMGLAVVRRVVDTHGGQLSLDSAPGRGTCVRIRLAVRDG